MRSSTADVFETLARPMELDLEQAMILPRTNAWRSPLRSCGCQGRAGRPVAGPRPVTGQGRG